VECAAFDAGNFCADQGGSILEILRAILRPSFLLLLVSSQSLEMLLILRRARRRGDVFREA
jgi:hypothetical protein